MEHILKGAPAAAALIEQAAARGAALREAGIVPTLAILRVGERADDLSYERGAMKKAAAAEVAVRNVVLPADVTQADFDAALTALNEDPGVHGILMFRPLPAQLDGERARRMLAPEKDVDGCTDGSLAGVFVGAETGFAPCTARAAVELLAHYGIDCAGKRAVVVGRSLVVGRPAAMLLLHRNATVTLCHTKTRDLPGVLREADIVIAAAGQRESLGAECFRPGAVIVDVGIHWNEETGRLCGDVRYEEAEPLAGAITPVPGGVGAVTSAVLVLHTVEAAERAAKKEGSE